MEKKTARRKISAKKAPARAKAEKISEKKPASRKAAPVRTARKSPTRPAVSTASKPAKAAHSRVRARPRTVPRSRTQVGDGWGGRVRKWLASNASGGTSDAALKAGWIFGMVGTPLLVAFLLWRANQPAVLPAPVTSSMALEARPAQAQFGETNKIVIPAQPANPPQPPAPPPPGPAQPVAAPPPPVPAAPPAAQVTDQVQGRSASATRAAGPGVDTRIARIWEKAAHEPIGERVAIWSEAFRSDFEGTRKRLGASLPAAPKIEDSAPLLPERFNCTTFVETVATLARVHSLADFYSGLMKIRYHGDSATFGSRNHFPEADWIPNNSKAGVLRDVTAEIAAKAGVKSQSEAKEIDRRNWITQQMKQGKVGRSIASVAIDAVPASPQRVEVAYIPVSEVGKAMAGIPNGTILNLVRKNASNQPVLITHQGFVVHLGERTMLKHVTPGGNIRAVELEPYLKALQHQDARTWPVLGINLNQLAESG